MEVTEKLTCDHTLPPLYLDAVKEGMIHLVVGSYVKNQILVFSLIGRETMLMKRCVLIGWHISTSFPVKKLRQKPDFSEDEFSAALVEALRNFHYDFLKESR